MLKKLKVLIAVFSFFIMGFITDVNVTHASTVTYGSWVAIPYDGNCQVRMGRDAGYYTASATTVNVWLETNGACTHTIYYKTKVLGADANTPIYTHTGYFNSQSATQYVNINTYLVTTSSYRSIDFYSHLYTDSGMQLDATLGDDAETGFFDVYR